MKEVHQFATSLSYGDAISDEMIEIQKVLREKGYISEIFTCYFDPRMAGKRKDYRDYRRRSSPDNVMIFHFSIGSPVSKMFFRVPDKKIMIYHNITPHEFFVDSHRILARECYKGRLELRLFVGKVDLALGDSDFNRRELEAVGYQRTGVLPILMDFSKFEKKGDPVTERLFADGKTTLLFVGRSIPNKKFEDVIKVFSFYKKYFNPNSRLILAGEYRGMDRYLSGLQELVEKLSLRDVHFTGHIEFPELLAYYEAADIYLSLSEHEGFCLPLVESMIFDLPVIAYNSTAVPDTLDGAGILIDEKRIDSVAELVDLVAHNKDVRDKILKGQRSRLNRLKAEGREPFLLRCLERFTRPELKRE